MPKKNHNSLLLRPPKKPGKNSKIGLALVMAKTIDYDDLDRARYEQLDKLTTPRYNSYGSKRTRNDN
jgi:hypothetical protein